MADLFLICYERDFMVSLFYNKEADIIQTSGYLDDLFK